MSVRTVIRMGHPTLRQVAKPVLPDFRTSKEFKVLIEDMIDTLHSYGGIGLAAPQIDVPLRLAIIEITEEVAEQSGMPAMPLTVFINPIITVLDENDRAGFWEGCLSVPGLRGYVERSQKIRVHYVDSNGFEKKIDLSGFLATVFQHEFDHIDGKLYLDHITDMTKLSFEEEYIQFQHPQEN